MWGVDEAALPVRNILSVRYPFENSSVLFLIVWKRKHGCFSVIISASLSEEDYFQTPHTHTGNVSLQANAIMCLPCPPTMLCSVGQPHLPICIQTIKKQGLCERSVRICICALCFVYSYVSMRPPLAWRWWWWKLFVILPPLFLYLSFSIYPVLFSIHSIISVLYGKIKAFPD